MQNFESELKSVAIKAAREAGYFLMQSINGIDSASIRYDQNCNPATKVDSISERMIIEIIKSSFPDHDFLGEELGEILQNSQYKWIIDPIDGTNNYIAQRDTFSVSIGLEYNNEIILGVVYLPKRDELFVAEKGFGATLNEKLIHISDVSDLSEAVVTYSTYPGSEKETKEFDKKIITAISHIQYFGFKDSNDVNPTFGKGSMAAEFCYLACGRIDGLIRLKQKPWDVAAGSLIASEAGAKMVNLRGESCSVYEGDYIAGGSSMVDNILEIIKLKSNNLNTP